MKFSETRSAMQGFSGAKTADYQMQYISKEVKDFIGGLDNRFVEYLTRDITEVDLMIELKSWLGSDYYLSSNENAKDCLEVCPNIRHLYGRRVKEWTDNALKCYDNFLIKYVQVDKKEKIERKSSDVKETDVYWHLIRKGGVEQEIGQAFKNAYQERNQFHHIQIEEENGIRIPRRISNKQFNNKRNLIIGWFKLALIALLSLVSE